MKEIMKISRVFSLRVTDNHSSINIEGFNTGALHSISNMGDCNNTLNINSIQNKFE